MPSVNGKAPFSEAFRQPFFGGPGCLAGMVFLAWSQIRAEAHTPSSHMPGRKYASTHVLLEALVWRFRGFTHVNCGSLPILRRVWLQFDDVEAVNSGALIDGVAPAFKRVHHADFFLLRVFPPGEECGRCQVLPLDGIRAPHPLGQFHLSDFR